MTNWVFDLDGTLVDSFEHYFVSLDEVFSLHGKQFLPEMRYPALTENLAHFFNAHLGAKNLEPALRQLRNRSVRDALHIRPFPGIIESLDGLRSSGAKVGVWTNRDKESAQLILKHSGLEKHVDAFVSGSCTKERKPSPEGLLRIAEEFKITPKEITMVGDHEHDVIAAKAVGASAVRASWHSYWPIDQCEVADYQFHELSRFYSFAESKLGVLSKSR